MTLNILDTLQEWIEPFKDFVFENHSNPLFWMAVIAVGMGTFFLTYSALNKEN